MVITMSDLNSIFVGNVVHVDTAIEDRLVSCNYGVVVPSISSRNNYNSVNLAVSAFACRRKQVDLANVDGVYGWKDVDTSLLTGIQEDYIHLIRRLLREIDKKWGVKLDIHEYSVLFGSYFDYFIYILDNYRFSGVRNSQCLCFPVKPFGVLCVMIRNGCVLVQLFNSVDTLVNDNILMIDMVKSIGKDFKQDVTPTYKFALLSDDYDMLHLVEVLHGYIESPDSVRLLTSGLCLEDLIVKIDDAILCPYNSIKFNKDGIVQLDSISAESRELLGETLDYVAVNKWYKSGNGLYYALLGNTFVYLTIESIYSCSGVVLYKEIVAHTQTCFVEESGKFIVNGSRDSQVIGRFRGSKKKKQLLKICFASDMALSTVHDTWAMSCEICDSLLVLQVLDGANQVDVYLKDKVFISKRKTAVINHIVFNKNVKGSYTLLEGKDYSQKDVSRLYNILSKADKNIFTKGDFKFVIYSYDVNSDKVLLDSDKNIIDTCYNFDDCLRICKSRVGKEFLIVKFESSTISGQWKVLLSGNKYCTLSKIA